MFFKSIAVYGLLLSSASLFHEASAVGDPSLRGGDHRNLNLPSSPSCSSYDTSHEVTSGTTVFWIGGGGADSEWLNKLNWQYGFLPGIHSFNRLILAVNDHATVHCDATYMNADVSLEARSGATIDATADLNVGRELVLKTGAAVTQSAASHFIVGNNLYLAANTDYSVSDQADLSVGLNIYMALNSRLHVGGDEATVRINTATATDSAIHGRVTFVLGPTGAGVIDMGNGQLTIDSTYAALAIDASSYVGGGGSLPLVINCQSVMGSFAAANVAITGLAEGMTAQVAHMADGIYLNLSGGSVTSSPTLRPTPSPTPAPVTAGPTNPPTPSPTDTPTKEPSPAPTPAPVTAGPTNVPTPVPTNEPTEPEPTPEPTVPPTSAPTSDPTPRPSSAPTAVPTPTPSRAPVTRSPTDAPIPSPTNAPIAPTPPPTDAPVMDSVVRLVLDEDGHDPVVLSPGATCPPPEASEIVIDGAAYAGGAATIGLYECSVVDANYDLLKIRLENFAEGLWFELSYKADGVDLVLKSLADYREYWVHVRRWYDHTPYAEQDTTAHFPKFSWDTTPTWIRYHRKVHKTVNNPDATCCSYAGCREGPCVWTDGDVQSIAQDNYLSWYGLNTVDHVNKTHARIKGMSENHTTMLYWNAESWWGMGADPDMPVPFDPAWLRSCDGSGNRCLYDHSNPAMRDWWVNHAKFMISQPKIDGVFTDNTLSPECDNHADCLETTVKSQMIKRLPMELTDTQLNIGNYLRQYYNNGNRFRMAYADGTYFENQHHSPGNQDDHEGIIVSMQLAREASWKKKVVMWTGSRRNCGCGFNIPESQGGLPWCTVAVPPPGSDPCVPLSCSGFSRVSEEPTALLQADLEKSLGEFLMVAERWSYINFNVSPDANCEDWRWNPSYMSLDWLDRPLGAPKGPPLKSGHTFSRHFEHLSVKVNTATEETVFIWK